MKKIFMVLLAAVLAALCISGALASGQGLFGELAEGENADQRLSALEEVANRIAVSYTTEDGITLEIGQAYYEGDRVYLTYRLSGELARVELHEGAPEQDIEWKRTREDYVVAEHQSADNPETQKAIGFLDGKGQRWTEGWYAGMADGLDLEDGTYADIVAGESEYREDGSLVGWKECKIPADKLADELTFIIEISRGWKIEFQDYTTYKYVNKRGEPTKVRFTLKRDDRWQYLRGGYDAEAYSAEAELALGKVDLKGTVRFRCPEQAQYWVDPDYDRETNLDLIVGWTLCQDYLVVGRNGVQGIYANGGDTVIFDLLYTRPEKTKALMLVPVYSKSGEHANEAIMLDPVIGK